MFWSSFLTLADFPTPPTGVFHGGIDNFRVVSYVVE